MLCCFLTNCQRSWKSQLLHLVCIYVCTCTISSPTRGGACWKNSFHALNTCVKMYQLISYTKLDSTSTFKKLVAGSHDLAVGLNNSCFSFLLPIISYILNCGKICTIVSYPPTTLPHAPHWAKNGNIITITRYINCLFLIRNTICL